VAVPTQQELPGVAVPVSVEDLVEVLLGDGGVSALFVFLLGVVKSVSLFAADGAPLVGSHQPARPDNDITDQQSQGLRL
jgi:hypothetical protein